MAYNQNPKPFEPQNLQLAETVDDYTGSDYYGPICCFTDHFKGHEYFHVRRIRFDGAHKYSTGQGINCPVDEKAEMLAAFAKVLSMNGYSVTLKKAPKVAREAVNA